MTSGSVEREDPLSLVRRAAAWAGIRLDAVGEEQLGALAAWLIAEAIPAGGLGPSEGPVVFSRHIADSLLFARAWDRPSPPASVLDVGSGVGLPGIPLAIAWPETQVTLLDRSARRGDLARRAIRILQLENTQVATAELKDWTSRCEMIVCRAVAAPASLHKDFIRLLLPSGAAVIGGSRRSRPRVSGYRVRQAPKSIMGYPVWLLSMDGT